MTGYNGECPTREHERNDDLLWLWTRLSFSPSTYVEPVLKDTRKALLFVRHRIQEAMRVSMLPSSSHSIPIYAYVRPIYKHSVDHYMSEVRKSTHKSVT